MRIAIVALLAVAACAEHPDTTVEDRGRVCAYAWPPFWPKDIDLAMQLDSPSAERYDTRAFVANEPALILVSTAASPCAWNVHAECTVSHQGDELIVSNTASWDEPETDCVTREGLPIALALCKTRPLEPSTYDLYFGAEHTSFAVPGDTVEPCFGNEL